MDVEMQVVEDPLSLVSIKAGSVLKTIGGGNSSPQVLLLQVLDDQTQQPVIKSGSLPTIKYIGHKPNQIQKLSQIHKPNQLHKPSQIHKPNTVVRLERIGAPAHVLDHQYASNKQPSDSQVVSKKSQTGGSNTKVTIRTEKPSIKENSNQDVMRQLRKQLQFKSLENQRLVREIKKLQKESKTLVSKRVHDVLKGVFSPRQIDKLMNPHKSKIKWSIEDIISAVCLQNISMKSYCHLRENNYPLPGLSTIHKWTARINVAEGILTDSLTLMKYKGKSLSVFQKIVVLNFGKWSILNRDSQVCMARGLFYRWIQPIFYSSRQPLTFETVRDIVTKLHETGYIVVAITCNFDWMHFSIWDELDIGIKGTDKCYFYHPNVANYKIFVFPYEFHLLINLRKKFLENKLSVNNCVVSKECVETLVAANSSSSDSNKMTKELLEESTCDKENWTRSKQLFSESNARAISSVGESEEMKSENWREVAQLFKVISDWSALFNCRSKDGIKNSEKPFGLSVRYQNAVLTSTEKLMRSTKCDGSSALTSSPNLCSQVILGCHSLKQLLKYLQESFSIQEFPIKYIVTDRLSIRLLEKFAVYLSQDDNGGDANLQSDSSKFENRLRKWILGRYSSDPLFERSKLLEPSLIDFNQKTDSAIVANEMHRIQNECPSEPLG